MTESGTRGAPVTVWGWTDDPTISPKVVRYAATVLRRLGYRTRVHLVPHDQIDAPLETIQVIPAAWGNDTPHGMFATPSERRQTAAALPCASTATCGESA